MIEERPHGDNRGSGCRNYDPARRLGTPSSTPPQLRFSERLPARAEPRGVSPLAVIRRIRSAIRLWRTRARSSQELCELSGHQLDDIGLRRQDVGYGFAEPFWHRD
jgi:uncharacterized protein YjiS (DUF1127 family)